MTRDELIALLPEIAVTQYVADWPEDEREYHRNGFDAKYYSGDLPLYRSFTDRHDILNEYRKGKIADKILAALAG